MADRFTVSVLSNTDTIHLYKVCMVDISFNFIFFSSKEAKLKKWFSHFGRSTAS